MSQCPRSHILFTEDHESLASHTRPSDIYIYHLTEGGAEMVETLLQLLWLYLIIQIADVERGTNMGSLWLV